MKKLFFIVCCLFALTGCQKNKNEIVMVTEAGFAPYEYYESGKIVGVDIDIANEIATHLGKKLVIKDIAFDSIINELNSGKADFAAAGMSITEERLKEVFRPEFLNRVDEIIVFNSLQKDELLQIVDLMLKDTIKALKQKDISFEISDEAKQFILDKGTNIKFGARPLRRAIQKYIEDEIAEMILRMEVVEGQTVKVELEDNKLVFRIV